MKVALDNLYYPDNKDPYCWAKLEIFSWSKIGYHKFAYSDRNRPIRKLYYIKLAIYDAYDNEGKTYVLKLYFGGEHGKAY